MVRRTRPNKGGRIAVSCVQKTPGGTALRPDNVHSAEGWREVLEPVVARYRTMMKRRYFRADAGFASPEVYDTGSGRWTRIEDSWVVEQRVGWCAMRRGGEPWRGLLII